MPRIPDGMSRAKALLAMSAGGLMGVALIALPVLGYFLASKDLILVTVDSNHLERTTQCGTAFFGEDVPDSAQKVGCDSVRAQQRRRLIPPTFAWIALGSVSLTGFWWVRRRTRPRTT
jgi:hypothetical protein